MKMKRKPVLIVAIVVAIVTIGIVLRISLPPVLKSYVNASLAEMGPYTGRVEDVDVALVRGAYTLHRLRIVNNRADGEIPFLDLPAMDISIDWRALFAAARRSILRADSWAKPR